MIIDQGLMDELSVQSKGSPRLRQTSTCLSHLTTNLSAVSVQKRNFEVLGW